MNDLPDLTQTSLPELMQNLHEVEVIDHRANWTFEQVIDHACSLAMGYGAGRDDLKGEFMATKERALRMARNPTVSDDEVDAALRLWFDNTKSGWKSAMRAVLEGSRA